MSEETVSTEETTETTESTETTETTEQQGETLITPPQETTQKTEDTTGDKVTDGSPETYEDFNLPDGVVMDEVARDSFLPVAKQLNLTQTEAQALVDYEAKRISEFTNTQESAWTDMQTEWRTATQSDKEIGGPAFDQSVANAKKFLNAYGTSELVKALDDSGMGNHPEVIRAFSRAGKAMSEDALVIGGVSSTSRAPEDILFPNQNAI